MKNTILATVDFYKNAFAQFIKAEKTHTDSTDKTTFDTNANKRIKNYQKVLDLLENIPNHIKLETETTQNGKYNIGTLVECILKAVADNFEHDTYTKATHGTDIKIGNKNYEIKTGIGCYSKPTACKPNQKGKYQATILVNANGIWLINADDVAKYLDKKGCLPYNQNCGKHYQRFEKALGYIS